MTEGKNLNGLRKKMEKWGEKQEASETSKKKIIRNNKREKM